MRKTITDFLTPCTLCPIACRVDRIAGERGACGADIARIYRHGVQMGEEQHIVPSYVIDLAYCNMDCAFCNERRFWDQDRSTTPSALDYATMLYEKYRGSSYLRTIQWIGGEPSIHMGYIEETSLHIKRIWPDHPPIYLNTNGYFDFELLPLMKPFIDGFVFDFKTAPDIDCVSILGDLRDYHATLEENIPEAIRLWGSENVVIRHLVIPDHVHCCTRYTMDWCAKHAKDCFINVMGTYIDFESGNYEHLPDAQRDEAIGMAREKGFPRLMLNGVPEE